MFNKKDRNSNLLILLSIFISLLGMFFYVWKDNSIGEDKLVSNNGERIKQNENSHLVLNTFKLDSLEIASADFDSSYTWNDANQICEGLGDGWRLPNLDELKLIFKNRKQIGGFKRDSYWTSDIHVEKITAFEIYFNYQGFQDVSPFTSKLSVRAVRNGKLPLN